MAQASAESAHCIESSHPVRSDPGGSQGGFCPRASRASRGWAHPSAALRRARRHVRTHVWDDLVAEQLNPHSGGRWHRSIRQAMAFGSAQARRCSSTPAGRRGGSRPFWRGRGGSPCHGNRWYTTFSARPDRFVHPAFVDADAPLHLFGCPGFTSHGVLTSVHKYLLGGAQSR